VSVTGADQFVLLSSTDCALIIAIRNLSRGFAAYLSLAAEIVAARDQSVDLVSGILIEATRDSHFIRECGLTIFR
jgi:hypothetical protein